MERIKGNPSLLGFDNCVDNEVVYQKEEGWEGIR